MLKLSISLQIHYGPQRSWGKVIFSEVCVKNSVHGGPCMARGVMHGRGMCVAGGHAWQWVGVGGHVWQGCVCGSGCMAGGACMAGGCAWQGRGVHGKGWGVHGIWSISGWYASYWNAFLCYQMKIISIKSENRYKIKTNSI